MVGAPRLWASALLLLAPFGILLIQSALESQIPLFVALSIGLISYFKFHFGRSKVGRNAIAWLLGSLLILDFWIHFKLPFANVAEEWAPAVFLFVFILLLIGSLFDLEPDRKSWSVVIGSVSLTATIYVVILSAMQSVFTNLATQNLWIYHGFEQIRIWYVRIRLGAITPFLVAPFIEAAYLESRDRTHELGHFWLGEIVFSFLKKYLRLLWRIILSLARSQLSFWIEFLIPFILAISTAEFVSSIVVTISLYIRGPGSISDLHPLMVVAQGILIAHVFGFVVHGVCEKDPSSWFPPYDKIAKGYAVAVYVDTLIFGFYLSIAIPLTVFLAWVAGLVFSINIMAPQFPLYSLLSLGFLCLLLTVELLLKLINRFR